METFRPGRDYNILLATINCQMMAPIVDARTTPRLHVPLQLRAEALLDESLL
jgi:hypothetical protein